MDFLGSAGRDELGGVHQLGLIGCPFDLIVAGAHHCQLKGAASESLLETRLSLAQ